MSLRAKRGLTAGVVLGVLVAIGVLIRLRAGATQDVPTPKLFAMGYGAGHDLAGFAGRPMVLVFGVLPSKISS